ncbi:hypothetical protein HY624_01255 [Candidatus Uhrbacteria bacterium]|nr:hypothetical protein [Candidatus Uhrbacteria bacterium]
MSRLLFVISAIVLVVVGLVSVGLLLWKRSGSEVMPLNTNVSSNVGVNSDTNTSIQTLPPLPPKPPERSEEETTLENFVRSFVERYGSYSTDAPFENLQRTFDDMTDRFRSAEERKIKPSSGATPFYGVAVHVQSMKILEQSPERVRVSVAAQWEEERGEITQSSRKTAELILLASGKQWKVDRVTWK